MRSSGDPPSSQNGRRAAAATNTGNSGSQYALCALGVGLVALGVVMIVWSVVPTDAAAAHNRSVAAGNDPDPGGRKSKASSVALVLVGAGVGVLLLSLCLGLRNKRREQQFLQRQPHQQQQQAPPQQPQQQRGPRSVDPEVAEEQSRRYAVPSYEEAVGSGPRLSSFQLPSYEDLVTAESLQYEHEGPATLNPPPPQPSAASLNPPPPPSAHKHGRNKLLPVNVRRIKSEKLHMKDVSQPPSQISIEPLTPPPQYEDKAPPL